MSGPRRWPGEVPCQPLRLHRPEGAKARLAVEPPPAPTDGVVWIVCPWLRGLDGPHGLWLAALPIHDANAYLAAPDPAVAAAWAGRPDVYWGVFALDLFRSRAALWQAARRQGIAGIVNLPSLAFFTGETRATFAALGFTLASETAFLLEAEGQGFRTGWFGEQGTIRDAARHGFNLLLTAEPPPAIAAPD